MKVLLLILAFTLLLQAQQVHERYDRFTNTTEATSDRIKVFKCGFLAPPCDMSLESFVLEKNGGVIESGLKLSVVNQTGWYPDDKLLYVVANGDQRVQFTMRDSKAVSMWGSVTTTLICPIDGGALSALLGVDSAEMRINGTTFKLKAKQLKSLETIEPYLKRPLASNTTDGVERRESARKENLNSSKVIPPTQSLVGTWKLTANTDHPPKTDVTFTLVVIQLGSRLLGQLKSDTDTGIMNVDQIHINGQNFRFAISEKSGSGSGTTLMTITLTGNLTLNTMSGTMRISVNDVDVTLTFVGIRIN
jgi:hypothetical protein